MMLKGRPVAPAPLRSLNGALIATGRIRVGTRLGGGAMGTVYEATDQGRPVAVKVLNRLQDFQVYRLKNEFRTLKGIVHPNVICVHELFREGDEWFFTMERVHGLPLDRHLEARRMLCDDPEANEADLRALVRQLIEGIATIHEAGLVHRDLKPTNILVSDDDRLVILDFGLVSEELPGGVGQTVDDRISGTFGYMSPNQLMGNCASFADDWYACGAILFQLLNGGAPPGAASRLPGALAATRGPLLFHPDTPSDLEEMCRRLLSHDAAQRPSAAELLTLTAAFPDAEQARPRVSLPPPDPTRMVGRERELEYLRECHRRAESGESSVVLVHGACGVGKTMLLRQFADELRAHGAIVLEGRCSEWESVPHKGLDGIMDQCSRLLLRLPSDQALHLVPRHVAAVMRLFPVLERVPAFREAATVSPHQDDLWSLRPRAISGLKDMFYRLSERHRLVLVIDDLQWVDADTMQLLSEILCAPDCPRLLLCLSARAEDRLLQDLMCEFKPGLRRDFVALGPLGAEHSRELVLACLQQSARTAEDALVERIVRESQGMPVLITEFTNELGELREGQQAGGLPQVLLSRIDKLEAPYRSLLELIALAVRPVTMRIADECGIADVQNGVHQLMRQRLVRSVGTASQDCGFETYSDHVRRVVLHALAEEQIRSGHALLARTLEGIAGVEPEWLLAHYRSAGSHERAKQYSVIVAQRAAQALAFDHAAGMYLAALELTNDQSPDWVDLNLSCAEALSNAGRGPEAAQAYLRAARALPPEEQLPLQNLAAAQWIRSGHLQEGVNLLRANLAAVGVQWPETSTQAILTLLYRRIGIRLRGLSCTLRPEAEAPPELLRKLDALRPAQTALGAFDYLRGATFAALALPIALKAREPRRLVVALASEAVYSVMLSGQAGEARAHYVRGEIERIRRKGTGKYEHAVSSTVRAMHAYWSGRWRDVTGPANHAASVLREHVAGAVWELTLVRSVRHTVFLHAARYEELAEELPDEISQASMRDDQYTRLDLLRRVASLHLLRHETQAALDVVQELSAARERYGFLALDHLIMSLVVATHLYLGDVERAKSELATRWRVCTDMGMDRLPLVRATVLGMEGDCIAADAGVKPAQRAEELRRLARRAAAQKVLWAKGLSHELLGRASALEEDDTRASEELRRASDSFEAAGLDAAAAAARYASSKLPDKAPSSTDDPEEDIESLLRGSGVANPDAWTRIAHTLY